MTLVVKQVVKPVVETVVETRTERGCKSPTPRPNRRALACPHRCPSLSLVVVAAGADPHRPGFGRCLQSGPGSQRQQGPSTYAGLPAVSWTSLLLDSSNST